MATKVFKFACWTETTENGMAHGMAIRDIEIPIKVTMIGLHTTQMLSSIRPMGSKVGEKLKCSAWVICYTKNKVKWKY